jgi:hypothetical protein
MMRDSRVSVLVYRLENLELGAAVVVSAERTAVVVSPVALREAVRRGVTRWMVVSSDGRKEWEYSGEDFNVGDLVSCLGDELLTDCLLREGVVGLVIEQLDVSADWVYDSVLVDGAEVRVAVEDEEIMAAELGVPVAGYWVMEGGPDLMKWGRDGDTVEPFLSKEEAVEQARYLMGSKQEAGDSRFYVLTVFTNGQVLTEEVGF